MLSYTGSRNQYGKFTQDASTTNLSDGDTLISLAIHEILGAHEWDFMEKTNTQDLSDGTQFYALPGDYEKMIDGPYVVIDSTRYTPKECASRAHWDFLNANESFESDFPEWYFIFDNQLGLWPTPASDTTDGLVIPYKRGFADMNTADYTTGTVDIITNGDETVTGSGTTWTSPMAGRWLKITHSNTAASSGDGLWYEIDSVTSTTVLELVSKYMGTSLTTGAAASYTIGQMPPFPENYHILPVLKAAEQYWLPKNDKRADSFAMRYDMLLKQMIKNHSKKTTSPVIDYGEEKDIINPNLTVSL